MDEKLLNQKWHSSYATCCKCGMPLLAEKDLGRYYTLDTDGYFYCTDCSPHFYNPKEDSMIDNLDQVLLWAYSSIKDDEKREFIISTRKLLYKKLEEVDLI